MITNFLSKPVAKSLLAIAAVYIVMAIIIWRLEHPPGINIRRREYEHALATWRAQRVEEYEITTETRAFLGGGIMTLHVSEYGNKLEELAPASIAFNELTDEKIEFRKENTIEGLFVSVDAVLKENEVVNTGAIYSVTFDPSLGYPSKVAASNPNLTDSDSDTSVTSLKIIKQDR